MEKLESVGRLFLPSCSLACSLQQTYIFFWKLSVLIIDSLVAVGHWSRSMLVDFTTCQNNQSSQLTH